MKKAIFVVVGVLVAGVVAVAYFANNMNDGERAVLGKLNDPDSAKFGKSFKSKRGEDFWCGEVNAKNRMGGYVGVTRYVAEARFEGENDYSFVVFEDTATSSQQGDLFNGRWRTYCE